MNVKSHRISMLTEFNILISDPFTITPSLEDVCFAFYNLLLIENLLSTVFAKLYSTHNY